MIENVLASLIIIETFAVADSFDGGDRWCRFLKYMASLISGICVILYQALGGHYQVYGLALCDITIFALTVTLALFFWPRMLSRFGVYKRRIGD